MIYIIRYVVHVVHFKNRTGRIARQGAGPRHRGIFPQDLPVSTENSSGDFPWL